ncbi:SDR family oxidoreductase [Paenibacillus sp. 598K]|uniref:SDR family NAD(P)-dependent oxidoreductase n=1 Tax=Paenibacillus sp. 598K TaxID=1117987 RepID=UPI000FF987C3|nr:SDR family NAD(P)-dependent oxidoreductase [Paenibacillus sp. 598K]GBF73298.1 SDR family oxidoreductase [Paenibacillus sp. 598K]
MFQLDGMVALVTGSTRGIGEGVAVGLARAGADIVLNSNEASAEAQRVEETINRLGRRVWYVQADVGREHEVRGLFDEIDRRCGKLDILVNNAGVSRTETIMETELENWSQVLETNLTSCFLCSKYGLERMMRQGRGRIIQISSVVAHQGAIFGHVHYAASKSGMLGLTKSLARTAAPYGITVNAVAPGIIDTELLRRTHGEERLEELSRSVPLGLGSVDDVAAAVVFLASDEARYMTGSTIDINGGLYFR